MAKAINSYCNLADFLNWSSPQDTSADTTDDAVIETILEAVSRYIDDETGRKFYPTIEVRYFDTPDDREIELDEDLLEVISVTNADGTAVTTYDLIPKNFYPKYAIRMKKSATVTWETNTTDYDEFSIDVSGYWGYHNNYSRRGWVSAGTLAAAISDTTTKGFTMTAGHSVAAGNIYKIDNEIFLVETVSTNTITTKDRGDNGSTAATHSNGATVYEWRVMPNVALACKMISQSVWRRFGKNSSTNDENIVLGSGVVITPRDVPTVARQTLEHLRRIY